MNNIPKIAITFSPQVGGYSVLSLRDSFKEIGCDVVDTDFRALMEEIPTQEFDALYDTLEGRQRLLAHAKAKAAVFLEDMDCLVLSGSAKMVDPSLYNKDRSEHPYDFSRNIAELALAHVALQKGMPVLGICAGLQLLAVYDGGSIRDLTAEELEQQKLMNYEKIQLKVDSLLAHMVRDKTVEQGEDLFQNMTFFGSHEQVVAELGASFRQTGTSCDGHSIEAAETYFGAPVVGIQFHPEVGAKGFPGTPFSYKRSAKEIEKNLDVFRYFQKAAQTYHQKKLVQQAIKKLNPQPDQAQLIPSQIKQQNFKQAEPSPSHTQEASLQTQEVPLNESEGNKSKWQIFWQTIKNFFSNFFEKIRIIYNNFLRNRSSLIITRIKVAALQAKEEALLNEEPEPVVSSAKILKIMMPLPAKLLADTAAEPWNQKHQLFQTASNLPNATEEQEVESLSRTMPGT